ncbi:unnamed protein product [Ilex paraguariensis]|uniref:Uncharacterized protein n=1 Tax=Ilex paraguariensis TaxID=185542 RepID=A0ABC8TU30_9AQUA
MGMEGLETFEEMTQKDLKPYKLSFLCVTGGETIGAWSKREDWCLIPRKLVLGYTEITLVWWIFLAVQVYWMNQRRAKAINIKRPIYVVELTVALLYGSPKQRSGKESC